MKKYRLLILAFSIGMSVPQVCGQNNVHTVLNERVIKAVLNGTEYGFNAESGCLESIVHPTAGSLWGGTNENAGLIDMAFPLGKFELLRVGSKYSKGATITVSENKVEIRYEVLGQNFPAYAVDGGVKVCVTLREAPDGISVILSAKVENASSNAVRQVLFPDIDGIPPKEGADNTFFSSCGFRSKPFYGLKAPKYGERLGYWEAVSVGGQTLTSGALTRSWMVGRWFDIGGYKGGFSMYERWWGHDQTKFWQKINHESDTLRMAIVHDIDILPGAVWESREYWLTPHAYGWSEGVKPYAQWVNENVKRVVPMPKHIKEGLGFRTLWMSEQYPEYPGSTVWKYNDLPALAKESKEHGIDEIVLWNAVYWTLPFSRDKVLESLGSYDQFKDALAECKKMGVNIVPFVSFQSIWNETCERYGMKPPTGGSWNYHTKLIPVFRPRYATTMLSQHIDQNNALWQQDVKDSFAAFLELGATSISWDEFLVQGGKENALPRIVEEYRKQVSALDPEASFSGESVQSPETYCDYLDYTWNWFYYQPNDIDHYSDARVGHLIWNPWFYPGRTDLRAYTNVFPPRANVLIKSDPMDVKHCFVDNLYMCPYPSKPGGVDGSARYDDLPELSASLKQCAALRKQFLPYFTDGTLIGDCVLTRQCKGAYLSAYHLGDKMLIIVLRDSDEKQKTKKISFDYNVSCWLGSGNVSMKMYDSFGKQFAGKKSTVKGNLSFDMKYGELSFVEISLFGRRNTVSTEESKM
jgi:hypothetical protein